MKKLTFIMALLCTVLGSAQNWESSFEEALSISQGNNKPIVLVFAGSDWCAPCIKMERDIWQSKAFVSYSNEHYVLYKADFPRKKANKLPLEIKEENKKLAELYNPKGHFPLVAVLNSKAEVLGNTGFKKLSPDQYISLLNSFVK
ncbi:MAG: thioredoxin family protein [Maribacter sp.]|nr:thioredoxin family protein [Maribacter sp.]NNK18129.1 thioredoxin family protein [Maribacter sp.]NNK74894.1 thioredoxin family protein [Maribacter sp.]